MYVEREWENSKYMVMDKISAFVDACSFGEFYKLVKNDIIGQDEELAKACYNVYKYLEALADGKKSKANFIISAPSGCGKTEFYRCIKKIINDRYKCDLPIIQIDMSSFTEVGYKGRNASEIINEIVNQGSRYGEGIVFLDEFDKKLTMYELSSRNDLNMGLQHGLLAMIEGCMACSGENQRKINTELTLFIGLGAFQQCRENKAKKDSRKSIGFAWQEEKELTDIYMDIDYQDILDYGCCTELLGRFSQIINFHRLSDEAYIRILKKYISKIDYLPFGCKVLLSKDGAKDFLTFANSEMGIREMRRRLDVTIQPNIIKLMLDEDRKKGTCIIVKGYLKTEELTYRIVRDKLECENFKEDDDEFFRPIEKNDNCPFV